MIILKPVSTSQIIKFIGRGEACTKLILRDEQDNTETTIVTDFSVSSYYLAASLVFDLKEGRTYNLTAYNNTDIVYKDKILCTSQTESDYSINDGEYIEHSTNNDYITL